MNSVVLIGRLTRDPELKFTASGKGVATFSIAVNRPFKKDETDFFNIVVWGKTAEAVANYTAKGRLIGLDGRIQNRSYKTKEGQKRYITEIIANNVEFLEWGEKKETNEIDGFAALDDEDSEPVPF